MVSLELVEVVPSFFSDLVFSRIICDNFNTSSVVNDAAKSSNRMFREHILSGRTKRIWLIIYRNSIVTHVANRVKCET